MSRHTTFADISRHRELVTLTEVTDSTITYGGGWTFAPPAEHMGRFHVGQTLLIETVLATQVTGIAIANDAGEPLEWLWLKTNEELDAEHEAFVAQIKADRVAETEAHREDWTAREAALPSPLRRRLERFRANGADFDTDGWGYELVVSELAVLYAASGGNDDDSIAEYARREGTSGNQHDYARAVSRSLSDESKADAIVAAPSALTPLTGDPDYSGSGR